MFSMYERPKRTWDRGGTNFIMLIWFWILFLIVKIGSVENPICIMGGWCGWPAQDYHF